MAEAWDRGFQIKEVQDPELYAYNAANAFPGEAAPNPLDLRFTLTTRLPDLGSEDQYGSKIIIVPPEGFFFPSVCRDFKTDTKVPGYLPIPENSKCDGGTTPELVMVFYRVGE
jgi:hypothetical protein